MAGGVSIGNSVGGVGGVISRGVYAGCVTPAGLLAPAGWVVLCGGSASAETGLRIAGVVVVAVGSAGWVAATGLADGAGVRLVERQPTSERQNSASPANPRDNLPIALLARSIETLFTLDCTILLNSCEMKREGWGKFLCAMTLSRWL